MATQGNYLPDSKFKLRPSELYIACIDMDFSWYPAEVRQVAEDYAAGVSLLDMADKLRREPDEVAILIMDLARKGRIVPRKRGVV